MAYDDRIDVVVESTPASREAKDGALRRIRDIDARGSTDLGGGWLKGAEQVALHAAAADGAAGGGGVHRVLLLTDGLANQGITDPAELARHAGELRARRRHRRCRVRVGSRRNAHRMGNPYAEFIAARDALLAMRILARLEYKREVLFVWLARVRPMRCKPRPAMGWPM